MSTTYQVCAHNDPTGMPLGESVLSTHPTADEAWAAIDRETAEFTASGQAERGGYLQRIVVEVAGDGTERVVQRES